VLRLIADKTLLVLTDEEAIEVVIEVAIVLLG
jgi:hypothetical protein